MTRFRLPVRAVLNAVLPRQTFAIVLVVASALLVPLLVLPVTCPICGGRLVKTAAITDDRNAASRNLCVWNRSVCANMLHGPDSVICTHCWHARSERVDKWERASESIAVFQKPLSPAIRYVPVPPADAIRSRVVFTQTYDKMKFTESLSFWCVNDESLLTRIRDYCKTARLMFCAATDQKTGKVNVEIW